MSDRARHPTPGQLVYLQLPAVDLRRAARFYQAAFGWEVEQNSFTAPGLIGQWFTDHRPSTAEGPLLWIYVDDLAAAFAITEQHGGEVLEQPSPDGPTRILATIRDPEGNSVGLVTLAR
jgi:predicted enzyme related to lactoylglutathione lyase